MSLRLAIFVLMVTHSAGGCQTGIDIGGHDLAGGGHDLARVGDGGAGCSGSAPACFGEDSNACCGQDPLGQAVCVGGAWMCGSVPAPGCDPHSVSCMGNSPDLASGCAANCGEGPGCPSQCNPGCTGAELCCYYAGGAANNMGWACVAATSAGTCPNQCFP
jgi:hypothetical protein